MKTTQNLIYKNNLLIAAFMNIRVYPAKGTPEYKKWKGEACDFESFQVKYNTSWDWIMPVVEKIERLDGVHVDIKENECTIVKRHSDITQAKCICCKNETKIEAIYAAIVKFIEWYNENN